MKIKSSIRKGLNFFGLEVHRFNSASSPKARLLAFMHMARIDLVFDIGANEGQFVQGLREGGYKGEAISIEPGADAFALLLSNAKKDSAWTVHPRCAVGASCGAIRLNVSANSVSSSVLQMLSAHTKSAPNSVYLSAEEVEMQTLDEIAAGYQLSKVKKQILLKIDTQGYEWQVLDGAKLILPEVAAVLVEVSIVPLYEGQKLWLQIIERLESSGFKLCSLEHAFVDSKTGQTLQLDAMFIKA